MISVFAHQVFRDPVQLLAGCLLALLLSAHAFSATVGVSVEEGKVGFLEAILEHTTWPEEERIEQFVIGLYGRDRALLKILQREVPTMRVRGRPVTAVQFKSLSEAKSAHILVLSRSMNSRLDQIEAELHGSHTLIVTDGSDERRHIMVNFTHPSETLLSFEVNRSNILYAGLQLSKRILLFGGSELDAALVYKETEAELARAKAIAKQQQQQLEAQQKVLAEQEDTIRQQRVTVDANEAKLAELERKLAGVQHTLEDSEIQLQENETALAENEAALLEKENILAEKEAYIESYTGRIRKNQRRLEDQEVELREQQERILEQNNVLVKQINTIENQRFILSAAGAALLLVLLLIAIIFRSYRSQHRLNMRLEGKTRELEVANQQLVQMTEAKSRFLSTMSHEIRTPMNGVIGMAELLEHTRLSNQQQEYVSLIIKSADTLLGLINDILDFSKIEAGRLELEAIPFKLRDIVGDTLQGLGLRAAEKGLELTYHIPPEVPDRLVGDPLRLRQILVNLVGNAIKFTEQGEVVVDLQLESAGDRYARVTFEVRDTGVGISEQQQQKIFEAFGQADSSTTRQFGGTGLGLSIASQLVEIMGGRMAVRSKPGQGSSFSFSADFTLPEEPAPVPLHPAGLRGQRVLVVDDNSTNRRILEELLQHWGMEASVVSSGANALQELDRAKSSGQQFVLALLDVMMPQMDGFDLAGRIREQPDLAVMRILMLTSARHTDQEALRNRLDISRILLKPVKHSDLLAAIADALGVARSTDEEAALAPQAMQVAPRQVLLVEDNPVNQKVAEDLLVRRGHSVEVALNGAQAVELVARTRFDVVLMDIHMPVMDGLSATRAIRENEHGSGAHVPIIAMTAGATMEDREHCFAAGMDAFVAKPFRAVELYRAVEHVAAVQQVERPQAGAAVAPGDKGQESCLDWQGALHALDGDEELMLELTGLFLDQCPALLADIGAALSRGDAPALRQCAHTLKGSAGIIGGRAVAAAALQLEQMGRDAQLEPAEAALRNLRDRVAELEAALHAAVQHRATATG